MKINKTDHINFSLWVKDKKEFDCVKKIDFMKHTAEGKNGIYSIPEEAELIIYTGLQAHIITEYDNYYEPIYEGDIFEIENEYYQVVQQKVENEWFLKGITTKGIILFPELIVNGVITANIVGNTKEGVKGVFEGEDSGFKRCGDKSGKKR